MKLKQNRISIQARTFEEVRELTTGEYYFRTYADDGYPLYIMPVDDPAVYLKRPNPPTPEAVEKAQFVDKTYVWKEASTKTKPS
jgi:hypothetical protein